MLKLKGGIDEEGTNNTMCLRGMKEAHLLWNVVTFTGQLSQKSRVSRFCVSIFGCLLSQSESKKEAGQFFTVALGFLKDHKKKKMPLLPASLNLESFHKGIFIQLVSETVFYLQNFFALARNTV